MRRIYFTDCGDILLASAAQDYLIRVWRFAPRDTDTGRKINSILDLPIDKDIQMRENTFSFQHKGENTRKLLFLWFPDDTSGMGH